MTPLVGRTAQPEQPGPIPAKGREAGIDPREDATAAVTRAVRALGILGGDHPALAAAALALRAFGELYEGRAGRAREHLANARRLIDAIGEAARPQGGTPHLSPGAGALTAREREIAALVTDGLSNQEIAERLCLSRRTVESHLSRVFVKLDVRSRTAMARRLTDPSGRAPRSAG